MVYCTSCGEQNPDDAEFCVKCGAVLNPDRSVRRARHERERGECFGLPMGGQTWAVIIGLLILMWGLSMFFGWDLNIFAIFVVIIGVIILAGAIRRSSRK